MFGACDRHPFQKMINSESYVQLVIREFQRLQSLADKAMAQISDEQFFASPAAGDNSVAVIVKHMGVIWFPAGPIFSRAMARSPGAIATWNSG
jgi:hypothetical protein